MKIKITNYTKKEVILREHTTYEDLNTVLEPNAPYTIFGVHNIHMTAGEQHSRIFYKGRYERIGYTYITIPADPLIDIAIER